MAPVARVRVVQGAIFADNERKPAGLYRGDHWSFRGQAFTRMSIEGPLVASLYDVDSGTPLHSAGYRKVWFSGGALHAPSGTIATLDAGTRLWEDTSTRRFAQELRFELRTSKTVGASRLVEGFARR